MPGLAAPSTTAPEEGDAVGGTEPGGGGSRLGRLLRRMKWVLYGVATAVYLFPPLDMTSSILPVHVRDIQWRFQATTFLGQSMLTQSMALSAAAILALLTRHRRGVFAMSMLCLGEAIVMLPVIAIFVADYFQIRPAIPDELMPKFRFVMAKTVVELLVGGGLMAALGVHLWGSTGREMLKSERKVVASEHQYGVPELP